MKKTLCIILLAAAFAAPFARPCTAAPAGQAPQKVAEVRFVYPADIPEGVPGLVDIKPGDPYSLKGVRRSIKLLYLKGIFDDIAVEGEDTPGGVVLTFRLVPKVMVSDIDIDGNDELSGKKIRAAMALRVDDLIEPGLIEKSRQGILDLYAAEGFRQAEVGITAVKRDELRSELLVAVKEGPPTLVSSVTLKGALALPEQDIKDELEVEPGEPLRKNDLEDSAKAITAYYVKNDYVNVSVEGPLVRYSDAGAEVVFKINAGPMLVVRFEDNESVSDRKLRKVLSFWEDRDVSEESISENLDRLTADYKARGYYTAVVTSRTEESVQPPEISIRFIVSEGPRSCLSRIDFTGNASFESDELKDVMDLGESHIFKKWRVTDDAVSDDLDRIAGYYRSRGYVNATVRAGEVAFEDDGTKAVLNIAVEEGPRTTVSDIIISGNSAVSGSELAAAIKLKAGAPYDPAQLTEDENAVLALYSRKGYNHAAVETGKVFTDDSTGVLLAMSVDEGIPVRIGSIIVTGARQTSDKVVTRELLIKPGDPYDYEKILRSQQRVFRLGLMSRVKIQPVEPEKVEPVKDLIVSVQERDAGSVEFGVGYGDFDLFRGFAEVSYRNLFGYGHRISARGQASTKELKGIIGYKWPWFMGMPLDFRSNLVYLDEEKVNYTIKDFIVSAGFDKSFGEKITSSIVYQFEKVELSTDSRELLAPEDEGKSNIASISPSVIFDYRDNPFNPKKGSLHGLVLKWATSYLGSTSDFLKVTANTSWYFPVYKGIIFGFSARGGIAYSITDKFEVPISERFFLGGASTLRGFSVDSVSPLGEDGKPVGGDAMVLMNAELRFPLPYGFGIVGFLDAGNVWLTNDSITVPTRQKATNRLRYGAGVGLRYDTPVGPLRLDFGFKLKPLPDEDKTELHFTIGHAF